MEPNIESNMEPNIESRATHARKEYEQGALDESTCDRNPIRQFAVWYDAAVAAGVPEPEAMTLSTATPDGRPSARIVLLRGFDDRGFCFYTNYDSRKGRELTDNPHAALTFHWTVLERQVRIEGRVERTTAAESDAYFHSRPSIRHGDHIGLRRHIPRDRLRFRRGDSHGWIIERLAP